MTPATTPAPRAPALLLAGSEYSSDYETETQTETDSQYSRESSYTDYTDDDGGKRSAEGMGLRGKAAGRQKLSPWPSFILFRGCGCCPRAARAAAE